MTEKEAFDTISIPLARALTDAFNQISLTIIENIAIDETNAASIIRGIIMFNAHFFAFACYEAGDDIDIKKKIDDFCNEFRDATLHYYSAMKASEGGVTCR